MRFCNTLQDYESAKNKGAITDDLFVVILQDKLAKFQGHTFDWSENADLTALATKGELEALAEEIASNERVWAEALVDLNNRINKIGTGVDDTLNISSTNPIQNMVVANALNAKADSSSLAMVATSGSYNDLSNKPAIPSEVTESTVSGWGFTKNTGTYSKPSTGIPKSDLASAVQTSLGKADTALQSYTEQYKGTVTGVKINGTTKNPSNGVVDLGTVITEHQDISGKQDTLVSGINIKTVQGESILGEGNIKIPFLTVESSLSDTSMNPVQNKVIKAFIDELQQKDVKIETQLAELSAEVNGLVGEIALIDKYVKNDGSVIASGNWKSTGWIKLSSILNIQSGITLSATPQIQADAGIYPVLFRNSFGEITYLETKTTFYDYASIPQDAIEVAFNFFKPSVSYVVINKIDDWMKEVEDSLSHIEDSASQIEDCIKGHSVITARELQPQNQINERYILTSGEVVNAGSGNTQYVVSEYGVVGGARYVICGSAYYNTSVIYAFYDASGRMLLTGGLSNVSGFRSIVNEGVVAPTNAILLRVAFFNNFRGYSASVVEFTPESINMLDVLRGGLVKESIDLTNVSYIRRVITFSETTNIWNSQTGKNCIILPLDGILAIELIGSSFGTKFTILRSSVNDKTAVGTMPDYADGYVNVHTLNAGERKFISVPQNGKFLYISREDSGNVLIPNISVYKLKEAVRRPIFSMSDDDTEAAALQWVEKIVDATGIPYTCALIKSNISDWSEIRRLKNKGITFLPHGITALTEMTEEEMETHFKDMQDVFEQHGLDADFYVYPQGKHNAETLPIVKKYFKGAFNAEVNLVTNYTHNPIFVNIPPIDRFNITRISIEDATVEMMKAAVDKALTNGGWCIFMTHAYWDAYTDERRNEVIEVIRYACEKGGEFLSLPDAFKMFKNRFESSSEAVGCDGITYIVE